MQLVRRYWLVRLMLLVMIPGSTLALTGCSGETPTAGTAGGSGGDAGGGSSGKKRIVLLTNGPDPFWDTCEAGALAAEKELELGSKGYVVSFERGDFTNKGQLDKLKQYGLQPDVAAVGISVYQPDSAAIADEMRALQQKGIKVITIDGDIDREQFRDARFGYLGTDNLVGGRELGRAAKAAAPDGAKFAFFVGNTSAANAVARMQGFVEGAGNKFTEIDRLADKADRPTARKNVEGALDRNPDLNMLVGIWAYNAPQIAAVVKDRNIRNKTKVVCFDADATAIAEMGEGNIDAMVVQNPYQMGHDGVKLLFAMCTEDKATIDSFYPDYAQSGEKDNFHTELRVVVPNDSPITADLFEKETQFMKYDDFKKWLQERSLVSS